MIVLLYLLYYSWYIQIMTLSEKQEEQRMENQVSTHDLLVKMEEFQQHYRKLLTNVLSKYQVTHSAFLIMRTLNDERKTLKELSSITTLDKSTLSRQVNTLNKKGWVMKEPGSDKRYSYLFLTDEALTLTNTLRFEIEQQLGYVLRGWPTDEKQLLLVLLGRANRSMEFQEIHKKDAK